MPPGTIGVGRFSRILQRVLEIKADPPLDNLASELMPTIGLEVDRPEWKYLVGEQYAGASLAVAAGGAGNRSIFVFVNPTSSGVIAVVERIHASRTTAGVLVIAVPDVFNTALGTNAGNGTLRDFRRGVVSARAACTIRSINNAANVADTALWAMEVPAATGVEYDQPIILGPGTTLHILPNDDNVAMRASISWRERAQEQSER